MIDGLGCLPVALDVHLDSHFGPAWQVSELRGTRGWLSAAEASLDTPFGTLKATIAIACRGDGTLLPQWQARHLLAMRYSSIREAPEVPPEEIEAFLDARYWDFLGSCDLIHLGMIEDSEKELEKRIDAEERRGAEVFRQVEVRINTLRRERRHPDTAPERRREIDERVETFETKLAEAQRWLVKRLAALRREAEPHEESLLDCLKLEGQVEPLFTIHWTARSRYDRTAEQQVEFLMPALREQALIASECVLKPFYAEPYRRRTIPMDEKWFRAPDRMPEAEKPDCIGPCETEGRGIEEQLLPEAYRWIDDEIRRIVEEF